MAVLYFDDVVFAVEFFRLLFEMGKVQHHPFEGVALVVDFDGNNVVLGWALGGGWQFFAVVVVYLAHA